jgi:cell wall-associated NlpC family hydrolase
VRRLILVLLAIFSSAGLAVSLAVSDIPKAVSEEPAASAQYHAEPPQVDPLQSLEAHEPGVTVPETPGSGPSEGSVQEARAPAQALANMEPARPYSQVVDNASRRRFSAPRWENSSGSAPRRARDFNYVEPARDTAPARYKVRIPTAGDYTIYARWPAARGNNAATRFGVSTPSGIRWTEVNQRRDGGMWMRIGAYHMEAGNRFAVRVSGRSKEEGRIVADAVMVVRGTQMKPPGGDAAKTLGERATGHDVVRDARSHIGTPYRHSPPEPCQAHKSEDCSCLTSLVFGSLNLPDDPVAQWNYGREVSRSELRPGDLVFFKEGGSSVITHVAIYSGNGNIIHASTYWGSVVERPMQYVDGYYGARRLTR